MYDDDSDITCKVGVSRLLIGHSAETGAFLSMAIGIIRGNVSATAETSITLVSSSLSIIGSLLIILSFVLWKDVRRSTARIILLFLATADFGTAISYFMAGIYYINGANTTETTVFCKVQSFLSTYFPVASFFWTTCLAIYFVLALVFHKPKWGRWLILVFTVLAWGVPGITCGVAAGMDFLGKGNTTSASWCFIKVNKFDNYKWYLVTEALVAKMWEILSYVVVLACYIIIFLVSRCKFKQVYKQFEQVRPKQNSSFSESSSITDTEYAKQRERDKYRIQKAMAHVDYKLLLIPIVFVLLRMWGTIRYFISMRNCLNESCVLYTPLLIYLQALGDPFQGFGNAVLFILFSKVILKRMCAPVILCGHCCFAYFKSKCKHSDEVTSSKSGPAITSDDDLLISGSSLSSRYGSHLDRADSQNSINV